MRKRCDCPQADVTQLAERVHGKKTEHSTQRRTAIPGILQEDFEQWREILTQSGHPARVTDFIIPGDLTHVRHGVRETETGACHLSKSHAKTWGPDCFTPAVRAVAQLPEFARILGATPYALRRGGISLRLRTEDPQVVASECGTSLKMLSDHYSFPIEDLREHEPRPPDVEWRAAPAAQPNRRSHEQAPRAAADHEGAERQRKSFIAWLSVVGESLACRSNHPRIDPRRRSNHDPVWRRGRETA
jgi:hypothetical protein